MSQCTFIKDLLSHIWKGWHFLFLFSKYVHTLFLKDPFLTYFTVLHNALDKGQMYLVSSFYHEPFKYWKSLHDSFAKQWRHIWNAA